jgi:hypothetical protein
MAAHRYWRMLFTRAASSTVAVNELTLAVTEGGPQAATGGTASAGSVSGLNVASRAFNGTTNATDYWLSLGNFNGNGANSDYLQYDMGSGNSIDVVEVRMYINTTNLGAGVAPQNFVLLHSDDGQNWTVRRAWAGQTWATVETKTFSAIALPSGDIFNRVFYEKDVRRNAATNSGSPTKFVPLRGHLTGDGARHHTVGTATFVWAGPFYIAGSTTTLGLPIARRVDLINQRTGRLERTVFTKADGQFLFDQINAGPWTVLGVDVSAEQNSVVYAHVVPAPMT